jgi:flagellum-specific peptidoglycan hydrolase FlgJ
MTETQKDFLESIKAGAFDGYFKYGILPSVTMAQAALESGWGKRHIHHNLFGIKWTAGCTYEKVPVKTHEEYIQGKKVLVSDYFRGYKDFNESVKDHNRLLSTTRYKKVREAKTYSAQAQALKDCGYATDSKYPQILIAIINGSKLYNYDAEAKKLKGR